MRRLGLIFGLIVLTFSVHHYLRRPSGKATATTHEEIDVRSDIKANLSEKINPTAQDPTSIDVHQDLLTNQKDTPRPSLENEKTTAPLSPATKPVERSATKIPKRQSLVSSGASDPPESSGLAIDPKDAKGAVYALYQAILWRKPDTAGGAAAVDAFSRIGWQTYIGNAKDMIMSKEFFERIAPNHSDESIINRMYAVFLNRCSSPHEMQDHMGSLRDNDTGKVTTSILSKAIDENKQKIFEGGYKPDSCPVEE